MLPGSLTLHSFDTPDAQKLQGEDSVGKEYSISL